LLALGIALVMRLKMTLRTQLGMSLAILTVAMIVGARVAFLQRGRG
jgi:flagellar biosynthesis protein FliQ